MDKEDVHRSLRSKSKQVTSPSHRRHPAAGASEGKAGSRSQPRGRVRSRSLLSRRASFRNSRSKSSRSRRSKASKDRSRSQSRGRTRSRSPHAHRTRRRRSHSRRANGRPSRSTSRRPRWQESPPARSRSKLKSTQRDRDRSHSRNSKEDDVQSLFFKKFLALMKNVKPMNDTDKFPVLNVIPEFDPLNKEQTMDTWLIKVDECAEIYKWSDKQIVHYAMPKLGGIAKTWYQGLPSLLHSWAEWKVKLRESFPTRENYAELLSEMLSKRVRFGEPLDLYYYSKMNLLNRCEITGKRAVDCLLAGIDDRNVRVGGQSAEFTESEQVLKFLKSIKVPDRGGPDTTRNRDKRNNNQLANNNKTSDKNSTSFPNTTFNMACYNCNEKGHPFYRCPKPKLHCTNCKLLGHTHRDCPKSKQGASGEKSVLKVDSEYNSSLKYKIPTKVNGKMLSCIVDLGSEGTLMRLSEAERLKLQWQEVSGPLLKGLGNVSYLPVGLLYATVEVQGITEHNVPILIVDDHIIPCPLLLGHTFTERPTIKIIKTDTDVIFQKTEQQRTIKYPLVCMHEVSLGINEIKPVPVKCSSEYTGMIYVHGSVRYGLGHEHYLLPGEYMLQAGKGVVLIQNIGLSELKMYTGELITRSHSVNAKIHVNFADINEDNFDSTVKCGDSLSNAQRIELLNLLDRYKTSFSSNLKDLGFTTETEMIIELTDTEPVVYRPYRLPYTERQQVKDMVQEMLDGDIIRESSSPYASPIVLVNKKSGEKRLCVDYRALNRKTKREHYPLPRIEDQLDRLSGSTLFITLDLASGYYQIPIEKKSRDKTAFVTPDGQYEYNRMPFGLVNAPSVFQRTMNKVIQSSSIGAFTLVYMDDILIPAKSFEEGLTRLETVLKILAQNGLTLKLSKCNFFFDKIDYLGYEVGAEGVRPGSTKTKAISEFPSPGNVHEVRRFLGLASFFRRFVKGFAVVARPLTALLKKDVPWKWGIDESEAFNKLKQVLIERPVLAIYDPEAETQLHTDASKVGVAGILMQKDPTGTLRAIAYYSRQTTPDEQKLHSYELETLAVISSLNKFRVYLLGVKFKIVTDCNALRTTLTKRDLIPRIARWWLQFLEYDCDIEYRAGKKMSHVDALSRSPIADEKDYSRLLDILTVGSDDWLTTYQQSDDEIKRITDILNDSKTKEVTEIFKNYKLVNGRVYRVLDNSAIRWLVPRGARWHLLKANHDDIGHFGYDKTLGRIRANYWFPKMRRFIKKYVAACVECAHHKLPSGAQVGELHPIPKVEIPFHTIHADHLGPFIQTKRGNAYILVIVDAFTKYINLTAVRNTKSATSIKVFREHFSYFGTPNRLITDQGTSFTSNTFKGFIKSTGIKHVLNAVSTPRANGQVERYNRTILAALGTMNHNRSNGLWDEHLPEIQLGINTTVHATTKKTPTELLFGRTVSNPSQSIFNEVIAETATPTQTSLSEIRSEASDLIKAQQVKDKEAFDKRRKKAVEYKEGDLVRVIRAVAGIEGQSKKLEPKCRGPYRIKKVLPNDRYVIEDTPITRKGKRYEAIVAVDKIFPWLTVTQPVSSDTPESSDNDESSLGE